MDDMASLPSPDSPLDDDYYIEETVQPKPSRRPKESQPPQRPSLVGRSQSDHNQTRRSQSGKLYSLFCNSMTYVKNNRFESFQT